MRRPTGLFAGTRSDEPQTAQTRFRAESRQNEYSTPGTIKRHHATISRRMLPGVNDFVSSTEPHFVQTTEAAIGEG